MEAAPAETEARLGWDTYGKDVSGTLTSVGTGKRNTALIAEVLKSAGEYGAAAQYCAGMEYGGYDDWFLPSKDELNLMYLNLKQKNLGGFSGDRYWSSTNSWNDHAETQRFRDGENSANNKRDALIVRAIRQF